MYTPIPIELKRECVVAAENGKSQSEIYREIFSPVHSTMSFESFRKKLRRWRVAYGQNAFADGAVLNAGTFDGFVAHNATVQVSADGSITQAWIKQEREEISYDEIVEAIKTEIRPVVVSVGKGHSDRMLELPLFDMHFGVATLDTYKDTLSDLVSLINERFYDEINIIVGQDLLHTNDMRGHTAKGTDIGKIDFVSAWADAMSFFSTLIEAASNNSNKTNVIYSPGNHDECTSWCLCKALEQRYPTVSFDTSVSQRKVISWRKVFVGVCHGNEKQNAPSDLRGRFTISFPVEFSDAEIREIHTGHLHAEKEADLYGVMIRRCSSSVPTDDWSDREGYVGAIKRFMAFVWEPGKLKSINYI